MGAMLAQARARGAAQRGYADALEEEPQGPRACVQRPRAHREAPQARRRPWKRRWPAPPPHQLRQVPSGVLREGRDALLPSPEPRCEPVLPDGEPGQALEPRLGPDPGVLCGQEGQGASDRLRQGWLFQGAWHQQDSGAARDRQGSLLLEEGRAEDQGGRRCVHLDGLIPTTCLVSPRYWT